MHNILCGAISCSHDMQTHAEYMRVCFLVLPYSLNEMGRSDENSEWMAGDELFWRSVANNEDKQKNNGIWDVFKHLL